MTSQGKGQKTKSPILECTEKIISGDDSAMERLLILLQNRLFRFCFHLTGNLATAEELAQEVNIILLSALEKCKGFPTEDKFISWLFIIAKRTFLNFKRTSTAKIEDHETRTREQTMTELLEQIPDEKTSQREVLLDIQEALGKLPEKDRMIIVLVDQEEFSYAEAAEIMGTSEGTLRKQLHFARKMFFEAYRDHQKK